MIKSLKIKPYLYFINFSLKSIDHIFIIFFCYYRLVIYIGMIGTKIFLFIKIIFNFDRRKIK